MDGKTIEPTAPPPALPPELEAVVVKDALWRADGNQAERYVKAAQAIKAFRAEMAK